MKPLTIAGVDASLTCTGLALVVADTSQVFVERVRSAGKNNDPIAVTAKRIRTITSEIYEWAASADLVVIEGPSLGSRNGHAWDRGGLWWQVVMRLHFNDVRVAVAAPRARAKYATGNGNADKREVCAAVKDWGLSFRDDNEADAIVLAAMGADRVGAPIVTLPEKTHRVALRKVDWPELGIVTANGQVA